MMIRIAAIASFFMGSLASADYYQVMPYPQFPGNIPYSSYSNSESPIISLTLDPKESLDSSLRLAARENRLDDLKKFVRNGGDVNSHSDSGETALMYGARNCIPKVVKFLIDSNAKVNLRDSQGRTALMMASMESCVPVVEILLKTPSIRVGLRDRSGNTALDYANEQSLLDFDGPATRILELLKKSLRPKA